MRTQDSYEDSGVSRISDTGSSLLPVLIYTPGGVLRGKVRGGGSGLLVDILNGASDYPPSRPLNAFLPLFGVEAVYADGRREDFPSTYVRKENILFAAQSRLRMVRRAKKNRGAKPYPNETDVQAVVAYTLSHVLIGKLEVDAWRTLAEDLGCRQRFLSLSDVVMLSPPSEEETRFALVAVNSSRILHITQLPRESEATLNRLTVEEILTDLLGLPCDAGGARRSVAR